MKIIPTLLTSNVNDWKEQMILFTKYFDRIQLDIADSTLVPNKTTQINEMIELLSTNEIHITKEATFDFHLMVEDYQRELEHITKFSQYLKVNTILINARLNPDIANLSNKYNNFNIGLDIDNNTNIDFVLKQFDLSNINAVQIMTVKPGFQGSPFLPNMLQKITQLRNAYYKGVIFIDGGINENTLKLIQSNENLPDYLCIGSYLTKAANQLEERINNLNRTIVK